MSALLLIAGLLAPTGYAAGVDVGGGVIAQAPTLTLAPWLGAELRGWSFALHAPLRYDLNTEALRARDWDEQVDFGRFLRFVRVGEWLEVGALSDITLGQGTIVRRYHSGVDDDHHRVGGRLHLGGAYADLELFSDQMLAAPVFGGRFALHVFPMLSAGVTFAADAAAPQRLLGGVHDTGVLRANYELVPAMGVDVSFIPYDRANGRFRLYLDANRVDEGDPGLHMGVETTWRAGRDLTLALQGEYIIAGDGYDWAYFDTGYLLDRWQPKAPRVATYEDTTGGRGSLVVEYAEALLLGAEYADAAAPGRADLSLWARVPGPALQFTAFLRRRDAGGGLEEATPEEVLAAAAMSLALDAPWWLTLTVANTWRVEGEGGDARMRPQTDVMLTFSGSVGL